MKYYINASGSIETGENETLFYFEHFRALNLCKPDMEIFRILHSQSRLLQFHPTWLLPRE